MRISRAAALFTCSCIALTITACGQTATQQPNSRAFGTYLYGADGNMNNPFGAALEKQPGVLLGMKGTRRNAAVRGVPGPAQGGRSRADDFNYAGEA